MRFIKALLNIFKHKHRCMFDQKDVMDLSKEPLCSCGKTLKQATIDSGL